MAKKTQSTLAATGNNTQGPVAFTDIVVACPRQVGGAPTGNVTFYVDGSASATVALAGGLAQWTDTSLAVGTHQAYAVYSDPSGRWLNSTSNLVTVIIIGGGMINPMTSLGDMIYGDVTGQPLRLPIGATGQVITVAAGIPAWQNNPAGFANPMTTLGDLIVGGTGGAATRVGIGSNYQVWGVPYGATSPSYFTPPFIASNGCIDLTHPPGGLTALVGDGVTDNAVAWNAIIAASPNGVKHWLPAGVYKINSTVDYTSLTEFALVGASFKQDLTNAGTVVTGTIAGNLLQANYVSTGCFAIRDIFFVNNSQSSSAWCLTSATSNFSEIKHCAFSGPGIGNGTTNGVNVAGGTVLLNTVYRNFGGLALYCGGCTVAGVDFQSCGEAMRAAGTGPLNVSGVRIEVCKTGINIGVDASGTLVGCNGGRFAGMQFEANDYHIKLQSANFVEISGANFIGSTNSPSGNSITGLDASGAQFCSFKSLNVGGSYTLQAIKEAGINNANSNTWLSVQATNGTFVASAPWVFGGPLNNNTHLSTSLDSTAIGGILLFDSFSDERAYPDGTQITARPLNTGQNWTSQHLNLTLNKRYALAPNAGTDLLLTSDSGNANVTASSLSYFSGTGNTYDPYVVIRCQDSNNFWLAGIDSSTNLLYIKEKKTGSFTTQASVAFTPAQNATYLVSFSANGSNLLTATATNMFTGSSQSTTFTNADFSTATMCGLYSHFASNALYFQNFLVTSP